VAPDPTLPGVGGTSNGSGGGGGSEMNVAGASSEPDSGGTSGASTGGLGGAGVVGDPTVIDQLTEFLEEDLETRPELADQPFAKVGLTKDQAEAATALLWEDWAARVRAERQEEVDGRSITLGDVTLRYDFTVFGDQPEDGRSLFLSLHGGGEAPASTNDSQWENQKQLYQPDEGIYLSPRAPTDTWNMWHQDHIDALFIRLVANLIVVVYVNPIRV
jgi:hypothetical protein